VPAARPEESINTVSVLGVVALLGETNSHGVLPLLTAIARNGSGVVPSVLVIEI